jgi:hypothetical protein
VNRKVIGGAKPGSRPGINEENRDDMSRYLNEIWLMLNHQRSMLSIDRPARL